MEVAQTDDEGTVTYVVCVGSYASSLVCCKKPNERPVQGLSVRRFRPTESYRTRCIATPSNLASA